ncbi:MAG: hypothetical protein WC455_17470 [Dehalococcoidia bacterium]|jgi:hypothetical protein
MKTNEFVKKYNVQITSRFVDENKNAPDWKDANHYKVTLRCKGRQLTTYFSQGYGIKEDPTAAGVIDCLASDAVGVENARSFEDWASEYGYATDSRRAERLFKICEMQAKKLRSFLGDDLYEELLWNTERE